MTTTFVLEEETENEPIYVTVEYETERTAVSSEGGIIGQEHRCRDIYAYVPVDDYEIIEAVDENGDDLELTQDQQDEVQNMYVRFQEEECLNAQEEGRGAWI